MKKIIAAATILLCAAEVLFAVPARPGKVVKVQPDGSRIVIRIHGDEYRSWVTNEAGDVMEMNEAGFYVTTGRTVSEAAVASDLVRDDRQPIARAPGNGMLRASSYVTTGTVHIPVILVQFSDTYTHIVQLRIVGHINDLLLTQRDTVHLTKGRQETDDHRCTRRQSADGQ